MKRMFSEEEIQKIAEAAGGGVTPEDVKAILDGALMSDETTQALVERIIDMNQKAIYVHNITMRSASSYFVSLEILSYSQSALTLDTFKQLLSEKGHTSSFSSILCAGCFKVGNAFYPTTGIYFETGVLRVSHMSSSGIDFDNIGGDNFTDFVAAV